MILHIAITTLLASMTACSDEMDPVLTQRDWDGTATYFQSTDEHGFSMYYKPQVGFVGDPMPFYDPVAKDFKVVWSHRQDPKANTTVRTPKLLTTPFSGWPPKTVLLMNLSAN